MAVRFPDPLALERIGYVLPVRAEDPEVCQMCGGRQYTARDSFGNFDPCPRCEARSEEQGL